MREPWEKLTQDMKNDRVLYMRAANIVVRIATSPACTRRSHLHPPGRTCTRRPHLHPPATAHRHAQDCVVDICGLLGDQSPFAVVVGGKPIREAWNDSLDRSVLKCLSRPKCRWRRSRGSTRTSMSGTSTGSSRFALASVLPRH